MRRLLLFILLLACIVDSAFAGLGPWNYTSSLNVDRFNNNVAVLSRNTIIFTFGGYPFSDTPYPVERSTIKPDGTLSQWTIESTQMTIERAGAVGFATDSYVYAIAGEDASSILTTVERAPINLNGTLGAWTIIGGCPVSFGGSALVQYNQYIYVISGYQGLNVFPNIYRTTVNPDGSLGTWTQLTSSLLVGRRELNSIVINTTVYVIGGENGANFDIYSVEKATIFPDGQLSAFTTVTGTLQHAHIGQGLFYDGNYLNALDGNMAERAIINPDGSLSNWETTSGLQSDIAGYGFVQTFATAYVIGGQGDPTSVEYAPLIPTGIPKRDWEILE